MAKALAERYRSITPEEKERLELLAKADKERFGFYILCQYAAINLLLSFSVLQCYLHGKEHIMRKIEVMLTVWNT